MPVPLALAAPAAAAGLAYFNAKTGFSQDASILFSVAKAMYTQGKREKNDRLNGFYRIEENAQDKKLGDRVFLIFEGRKYTNKQFYDIALRYGTLLKERYGVKSKDIVAMAIGNSDIFLFVWYGLWSIGARPAFINTNLSSKPLTHTIRTSTTSLVIIDPEFESNFSESVKSELAGIAFVTWGPELEAAALETKPVRQPDSERLDNKASNLAMLIYTSGTTGLPKPANVGWNKTNAASIVFVKWLGYKSTDIFYTSMPLYHSSASVLGVCNTVTAGGAICIGRKFSTKTFWKEARESKATIIQYVGETLRYLLSAPPQFDAEGRNLDREHNVRIAFGNGLRPDIWNRFKERFRIETVAEFYAATEGAGATMNLSRNDFSKGAIGRGGFISRFMARRNRAIVEVDWETEQPWRDPVTGLCKQTSVDEPGELLYKLDPADVAKSYQGYFGNNAASQSKIMRDVLVKGDIYFRTGDTVRNDAEGRTYFMDRIGDTFRWKGENVSTNEVSEVLGLHKAVQEANVYGVQLPNHDGRAGCVAIILAEQPSPALMSGLAQHVTSQLPRYAVPLFLRVTQSMELTGTNKQQKHIIRGHGVDPSKVGKDELYWLREGSYVKFQDSDWHGINGGRVKL